MEDNHNSAFLQFKRDTCTLTFYLEHKSKDLGKIQIDLEIKETVGALLRKSERVVQKVMKQKDTDLNISLWSEMELIDDSKTLTDLRTMNNIRFHILDAKIIVETGQPTKKAQLEDVIFCGLKIRPITKNRQNANSHEYWWFKSKDTNYWIEVGKEFTYKVKETDVGFFLKFQFLNKTAQDAVPGFVISERVVLQFPEIPRCPFEIRQIDTPDYLQGKKFRFVTYNILSARHTQNQYDYCPPEYLSISYRSVLLMRELIGYKADIICLQEVDFNVFRSSLSTEFRAEGFKYDYYHDHKPGSLAIFYNPWKFRKTISGKMTLKSELIKNRNMRNLLKVIIYNSAIFEMITHLETSIQFCEFVSLGGHDVIIVVNTHLYYLSKERNVRLLQTAVCLEFLKELCNNRSAYYRKYISVIFSGDFNSNPKSSVFEFITKGKLLYNYDYDDDCVTPLQHPFSFKSASGAPPFTNYTKEFKDCLDYIFYDNLKLLKHVPIPVEEVLSKDVALPSAVFPSDHVPLIADFKFR